MGNTYISVKKIQLIPQGAELQSEVLVCKIKFLGVDLG